MTALPIARGVSYEDYLAREAVSQTKHEYLRGEIFDTAGGTPEHGAIAVTFTVALANILAGRPCRVFNSDVMVRIDATNLSTYPDISVVCGSLATSPSNPNAITNPILLVEVLSPGTEAYDRGAKFGHYRHLPSLKEMVFVDHATHTVEVFRRNEAGRFELHVFEAADIVELASVDAKIPVATLYADPLPVAPPAT
jgi:Uma2 family endonuclease